MWETIKWSVLSGVILAGLLMTYAEFWKDLNGKEDVPSKKYAYWLWFAAMGALGAVLFYVGAQWTITVGALIFLE